MKAVCSVLCLVCHACCVFLEYEGSMHKSREWLWLHGGPGAGATFPLKDSMARSGTGVVGWQGGKGPTTQSWRGSAFQVSPSPKKKTLLTVTWKNLLLFHLCYHTALLPGWARGLRVGGGERSFTMRCLCVSSPILFKFIWYLVPYLIYFCCPLWGNLAYCFCNFLPF